MKLLYIDNDEKELYLLQQQLEGEDLTVIGASSGAEAEKLISKESYDVTVIDVILDDESGYQIYRKFTKSSDCVILTSGSINPYTPIALRDGVEFVPKTDLVNAIRRICDKWKTSKSMKRS
jgi:DNA-binding NtrC family response regulator